ncbi:MAG TPA: hypothetical protein VGR47_13100 [Terracidiphilus sp.]|nr:hypothetical protein [Terracidiphilus sp.]
MRYSLRTMCSIALLLCFITPVEAQSRVATDDISPTSVVQKYCKLDLDGARLSSQNPYADAITALATWPIEPGWDTSVVVSSFEIVSRKLGPKESTVTVRYIVLGNIFGAKITSSQQHKQLVTFTLTKSSTGWLIERPLIAPHVSVSAAISALNSLLSDEKNPEQIKRIKAGIDVLTKWKSDAVSNKLP